MTKSDFHKGQGVYLLIIEGSNMHRHIRDDSKIARIRKAAVTSVGHKYVTVSCGRDSARFSIEDQFMQVVDAGSRDYQLFLTYEDVIDHLEYQQLHRFISDFFDKREKVLSLNELRSISDIIKNRERQETIDD